MHDKVNLSPNHTIVNRHSVCALVVCLKYVIQCSIKMRFEVKSALHMDIGIPVQLHGA